MQHSRFKLLMIAAVVILSLGTGFSLKAQQMANHQRCVESAERAAAIQPALQKIAGAAKADGDTHMARFWQAYLDVSRRNPIPKC